MGAADIRDAPLQKVNLNLIPVLRALLKEGSVSRAAIELGRSPSAISEALAQLRTTLEDPLFVRVGGHLKPTPRAAELAGPLDELYHHLEAFFEKDSFDASHSTRKFTIASSDLLIFTLGLNLVQTIRRLAPRMTIHFVDVGAGLTEKMAAREIDFVLLPEFAIADLAPAPLRFQSLSSSTGSVALMSRDHPLAAKPAIRREDLAGFRHIRFRPDPVLLEGRKDRPIDSRDQFDTAIFISHYVAVPHLLQGTDLVALVPLSVAQAATPAMNLVAIDFGDPPQGRLGIAWSPIYDRDPAHQWFRNALAEQTGRA